MRLPTSSPTQALANMATVLEAAGCDYRHVVKTTVLLQDIRHLPLVDAVYGEVFRVAPPARTVYQVSGGRGGVLSQCKVPSGTGGRERDERDEGEGERREREGDGGGKT